MAESFTHASEDDSVPPRLGAHMSAAGGLPLAVDRAVAHGCEALQIFAKNANQWRGRAIQTSEIREFRERVTRAHLAPVVSHASYLINLAASRRPLRAQSIAAMADELDRADALGLLGVVLHPGSYTDGTPDRGLALVADALDNLLGQRRRARTLVILEHTAGQGTALGATFEDLRVIIDRTRLRRRVGVCLDTCHLIASGYDIATPAGYSKTFEQFDRIVGFDRLKVFHVNDSMKPLGSRVDRHTHIGEGAVGLEGFRRLVNDPRFAGLPMLLETPKSARTSARGIAVDPLDRKNLEVLRGLMNQAPPARPTGSR
jgi:deoxyribonuclease-4